MTAPVIADLRRELEKARITLIASQTHLAAHAEANAALHCATTVLYSPLHAQVTAAIGQIEHALERTEQPYIDALGAVVVPDAGLELLGRVLLDLDRCKHGRHAEDSCSDCGVVSKGNPHMPVGSVVGYDVHAEPIVMPDRSGKHDPKSWRGNPARAGEAS